MSFPIFSLGAETALTVHDDPIATRDAALIYHATRLAMESAYCSRVDFPVGAVAAVDDKVVGHYYASDNRLGDTDAHAEYMAMGEAKLHKADPDTMAVTLEPCDKCQDFLIRNHVERIVYGLPRSAASDRGLVKPHAETIEERFRRLGITGTEVVRVQDEQLQKLGELLLDAVNRDLATGKVTVSPSKLSSSMQRFNNQ